jgi:LysR family transcriptional activator of nhaA
MEWLNYHHLLYFWTVAREGSMARAGEQLRLAQPTLSGQIRKLEDQLGEKLFLRSGRRLVLTDVGRLVFEYADQIFGLGREMLDTLRDRPTGRPMRFQVGVTDEVSKIIACRFLQPALALASPVHIVCREGPMDRLAGELATHALDLVIADSPITPVLKVKAYNHALGDTGVTLMAAPKLAAQVRTRFPRGLDGAPFLLPTETKTLRRSLDLWFDREGVRPRVIGEFDDSALLKTFGQGGAGVFAVPAAVETEVTKQYGVAVVGRLDGVRERYYAISVERRLKHPAVVAISESAHEMLAPRRTR